MFIHLLKAKGECLTEGVVWQNFFWEDAIHIPFHARYGEHDRPKCGYHQSPTWWSFES